MDKDPETQKLLNGSVESPLNALPQTLPKQRHKAKSHWIPSCWYIDCLPCIKARYVLAFMLFLGLCNVYALRVNLSVAIVQMTSKHPHNHQRSFDWSSSEQGWVLSSFFFGYLITQIPGGWLATRFGGKYVFGVGVLVTSLLTLITPQMAYLNIWALVACRVVIGFFEGVTFPSMIAMFGVWSPPLERSMLTSIALSGPYVGNVVAFPLSGVLCETMGWPWVFYCFGFAGIVWFIAWMLLVSNTPAEHPRISPKELEYIESTIRAELLSSKATSKRPPPWKYIFTSPAVIAIAIANFCSNWGFYTLLTCLPTFLKQTLCLDIKKNGFYSAIPYLCEFIVAIGWGQVTDILRQHKLVSTTVIRKVNNTLGLCLPALFLLLCSYYGTNTLWAIIFLSLSVGSIGFTVPGFPVNNLDVAPKYAGIILGFANMIGTIPGFLGPIVAKLIAKEPTVEACGSECNDPLTVDVYEQEWRLVFIIAAEVYVFGAMGYNLLGSGKKQPWAEGCASSDQIDDNTESFKET